MKRIALVVSMALILPVALAAARKPRRAPGPNVLLITIDTLRADHLSCDGYFRRTSPHIDHLASQGVLFQSAYTPIPLTGPAHISLMTSLYPQQHGATINGMHMTTKPRPITLAQILHHMGYHTAAFVSAWPLKKGITGLGRGFDVYNQDFSYHYELVNAARTSDQVNPLALRWLKRHAAHPFFLWVHYFDPHQPYVLHPQYADLPTVPHVVGTGLEDNATPTPEEAARIKAYDSEIAYTDQHVGVLLHQLDVLGIRERTLVVLMADHGESLGEHGYVGHGDWLYQPIVHIPLMISYPGVIPAERKVAQTVGLIDVMPTILDYLGVPLQRLHLEGQSLKPLMGETPNAPNERSVFFLTYAEPPLLPPRWMSWIWRWAKTKMVPSHLGFADRRLKVICGKDGDHLQVFDLNKARSAANLVADVDGSRLQVYRVRVAQWFQETNKGLTAHGRLSKEDLEMLHSIGYVNN